MPKQNHRPIGPIVDPLPVGNVPDLRPLHGKWVRLEHVTAGLHAADLFHSFDGRDPEGAVWTYMGYGPFSELETFSTWVKSCEAARDPWFYAFISRDTGKACGMGSIMRNDAANGVIEIGHIWMAPGLQKTRAASEIIYLMMRHCFDEMGVRRLEWKCNALNAPSMRAAERFGFTFEGTFRQHMIIKGRNRDTAWFAMLDKDWPQTRQAFEIWLEDSNFDASGRQKAKLRVKP